MQYYLQIGGLIVKLSSDIDISSTCAHGPASNQAALHQFMWVIPHYLPVLTSAWFSLISIHHQILWPKSRKKKVDKFMHSVSQIFVDIVDYMQLSNIRIIQSER